jgi:hypothetical protein
MESRDVARVRQPAALDIHDEQVAPSIAAIALLAGACMRGVDAAVALPAGQRRRDAERAHEASPLRERVRPRARRSESLHADPPQRPHAQPGVASLDGEDAGLLLAELLNAHLLAEARRHGVDLS